MTENKIREKIWEEASEDSKNKITLMEKIWEEGSEDAKKKMQKHKLLIQSYTYACMEELEKEQRGG